MRLPKRGEKGFTLIELLIVVAILGVLAAVVIPNVGRFIGRGETEAAETELANIQSAVTSMMVDNNLQTLRYPCNTSTVNATNVMSLFPDPKSNAGTEKLTDPDGDAYMANDGDGYLLYQHDVEASNSTNTTVNYVAANTTSRWYTVDTYGTVTQYTTNPVP